MKNEIIVAHLFGRDIELAEVIETGTAIGGLLAAFIHGALGNGSAGLVDLAVGAFAPIVMIAIDGQLRK